MIPERKSYDGMNVTYNVTEDCNLRCSYCYEVAKRPRDLPFEYARIFTGLILTDPDPILVRGTTMEWILEKGLILDFIGGDALMRYGLVRDILRDFVFQSSGHRWGRRWRASISTNGTFFTDPGVRDFLEEFKENLSLGVSVDGCPEIHDRLRSDSMGQILAGWDWYMRFAGEEASTKATLNKESIPYLSESLRFLHEVLGLKQVNMNFIFEKMGETDEDLKELDKQMALCVEYVGKHSGDLYWSILDRRFAEAGPMERPEVGWCGSGSMPCLGVNGYIYPCFRFMPHTMHKEGQELSVGDVWTGLSRKGTFTLVRAQCRGVVSEEKCKACEIETSCAWCIGSSFAESGKFYRQTNICNVTKLQAKWAKEYWRNHGGNT